MEPIYVEKLPITLAQLLKLSGLPGTGGAAKEWVRAGLAAVNGVPCLTPGKQLQAGDEVRLELENGAAGAQCFVFQVLQKI